MPKTTIDLTPFQSGNTNSFDNLHTRIYTRSDLTNPVPIPEPPAQSLPPPPLPGNTTPIIS